MPFSERKQGLKVTGNHLSRPLWQAGHIAVGKDQGSLAIFAAIRLA
jgi:hypothetical protein